MIFQCVRIGVNNHDVNMEKPIFKFFLRALPLIVVIPMFSGCAATAKLPTTSGRPEVAMMNISTEKVVSGIRAWLPTQGKILTDATENTIGATFTMTQPDWFFNLRYPAKSNYTVIQKWE